MAKAKSKKITLEEALVPVEEQPYEVPENWCWTFLSNVAEWGAGGTPSRKKTEYYGGDIPWIKTGELDDDYIFDSEEKITEDAVANSSAKLFPIGSVLVAMYGATIGKTAILGVPATTNQACACARCNDFLDNKYLFYYLRLQKDSFIAKGKGGAQPNISQDIIKNHPIPLPPLPEQQRIVEQIESLFAKLDEANEKAQEVIDRIETNIEAILYNAFSGKLTQYWRKENGVDYNWENSTLSKIVSGLKYGSAEKSDYNNNGTPVLRIPNIGEGVIDFSDLKYMQGELENSSHEVFENDILIIRSNGSRDLVGKCAIVPALERRYAYASFLIRIKASEKVLPKYLVRYINSSMARGQLFAKAKSSSGIHNINSKELGSIRIDVPTIEEQTEILKIIEPLIKKELDVKDITSHMIENIAELKKTILAKAFRGELGTNIKTEESAITKKTYNLPTQKKY